MERLCAVDSVPEDEGLVVETADGPLLVVRHAGGFRVYEDRCPHMGISLRWPPRDFLSDDGRFVECVNHNALFRIADGVCVFGPCEGEKLFPRDVVEADGALWLKP